MRAFRVPRIFGFPTTIGLRRHDMPKISGSPVLPTLRLPIASIVELCAKPEMIWIDTGWVVAGVKDEQTDWDLSSEELPRQAMSSLNVRSGPQTSIPTSFGSHPQPTLGSPLDFRLPPFSLRDDDVRGILERSANPEWISGSSPARVVLFTPPGSPGGPGLATDLAVCHSQSIP